MNCLPCLRGRKKSQGKKSDGKNEDKKEDGELPVAQPKQNPLSKQPTVKITGSNKRYDSYKQSNLSKQEHNVDIDVGVSATVAPPVVVAPVAPAATIPIQPTEVPTGTFKFHELAAATQNFKREFLLGESGFGKVYKGILASGKFVAVKQLDKNGFKPNKEFLEEVSKLSALEHPNLVELVGYCVDGDQRLLVYEYMPNGSLKDNLFGKTPLDWATRMQAASGAAQAMQYLHEKVNPPVLCRNLKCTNILLDENFEPKVSDFGLVNLESSTGNVQQRVVGTVGCAPEYERTGQLTVKSDVYSFGVILLELITGRKALDTSRPRNEQNLVSWAQPYFRDPKRYQELADPMFKGVIPEKSLNQAVGVAAMCLQEESNTRPLISDIVDALSFLTNDPAEEGSPLPASALDLKVEPYNPPESSSSSSSSSSSDSEAEKELGLKIEPFNRPVIESEQEPQSQSQPQPQPLSEHESESDSEQESELEPEPQPEPEPEPGPKPESDSSSSSSSDSDTGVNQLPVIVPIQESMLESSSSSSSSSSDSDTEPISVPVIEPMAEPSKKDQTSSEDGSDDSSVVYEEDAYSEEEFSDEDKTNKSIPINPLSKPPRRKSTKKRVAFNAEETDSVKPRPKRVSSSQGKKSFKGDRSKSKSIRKSDSKGDDSDAESTDESDAEFAPQRFKSTISRFVSADSKVYNGYADESDHSSSSGGEQK